MERGDLYGGSAKKGWSLWKKIWVSFVVFLVVFFVAFGIGFAGGQNVPPTILAQFLPAAPPPPPWYMRGSAPPQPSWAPVANYRKLPSAVLGALSPNGTWDRLTWDSAGSRLFIGLQNDGLAVIGASAGMLAPNTTAARVAGTAGCNGLVIAKGLGFCGDAAAFTGTAGVFGAGVTVLNMSTLAVVAKVPVAQGVGVDNGVFDVNRNQVLMTLVNGSIMVLNAATGSLKTTLPATQVMGAAPACAPSAPCDPLEFPVVDASYLYVCAAMLNAVLVIDLTSLQLVHTWSTATMNPPCYDPTGLAIDTDNKRLFVGCGDAGGPALLVLSTQDGSQRASLPIGRGNDGVVYDKARGRVMASSGVAGNIAIIKQNSADTYALQEVIFTKAGARTIAQDPASGALFTMAPDGRYNPALPYDADSLGVSYFPNDMFPNSLEVLAFGAK